MNVDALIPHFSSMLGAQLELQQRASILRGSVIEERIAGKDIRHVIPGKRELKDKIYKHQMLTPNEGSFRWRKVESVPAYDDVWLSREDEIRSVLVNYGQSYAESLTSAVGRKIDERIISGLMGTAYEGTNQETFSPVAFDTSAYVRANKTGGARLSSTSPTWEAMNEGRTCLAENENDMSFVTFVTTNRVWERFVADGPNQVWWNSNNELAARMIVSGTVGDLIYGLNIRVIESDLLNSEATGNPNTNYGIIYTRNAAQLVIASEPMIEIDKVPSSVDSRVMKVSIDMGCSRLIERGVFFYEFSL